MFLKNSTLRILFVSIFTFSALFSAPIGSASENKERSHESSCKEKNGGENYQSSMGSLSGTDSKSMSKQRSSREEDQSRDKKCKNEKDDKSNKDEKEDDVKDGIEEVNVKTPGEVSNLLVATCSTNVTLTWNAPTKPRSIPISNYSIRYSSDSGLSWTSHPVTTTQTTITINALTPGLTYIFQVAAQNINGLGAWSNSTQSCTVVNQTPTTYTYSISGLENIVDGAILEYSPDGTSSIPTALVQAAGPQSGTFSKGLFTYDLYLSLSPGVAYTFNINGVPSSPAGYFPNYLAMRSSQGTHPIAVGGTDFFYQVAQFFAFQINSGTSISIEIITPPVIIR